MSSNPGTSPPPGLKPLCQFLQNRGFVLVTVDHSTPDLQRRYEAWAYTGPLDFEQAGALCFGLGPDPVSALHALAHHLIRHDRPTSRT